jgi:hypothetical protein
MRPEQRWSCATPFIDDDQFHDINHHCLPTNLIDMIRGHMCIASTCFVLSTDHKAITHAPGLFLRSDIHLARLIVSKTGHIVIMFCEIF